jgi:hypothetical protein
VLGSTIRKRKVHKSVLDRNIETRLSFPIPLFLLSICGGQKHTIIFMSESNNSSLPPSSAAAAAGHHARKGRGELSHRDSTDRMKKQAEYARIQGRAAITKRLRMSKSDSSDQLLQLQPTSSSPAATAAATSMTPDLDDQDESPFISLEAITEAAEQLKQADMTTRKSGINALRRYLCSSATPPIDAVVDIGCVPLIGNQLTCPDEDLVREALWLVHSYFCANFVCS